MIDEGSRRPRRAGRQPCAALGLAARITALSPGLVNKAVVLALVQYWPVSPRAWRQLGAIRAAHKETRRAGPSTTAKLSLIVGSSDRLRGGTVRLTRIPWVSWLLSGMVLASAAALALAGASSAADETPATPTRAAAWIARVIVPTAARTRPGAGPVVTRLGTRARWNGGPVGLLVLGTRTLGDGRLWLRVRVPVRPNGTSAWIPADVVRLRRTAYRVEISTGRRLVRLLRGGRIIRSYGAVVGQPDYPTPHGLFAVGERVAQPTRTGSSARGRSISQPTRMRCSGSAAGRGPCPARSRAGEPGGSTRKRPLARLHPGRQPFDPPGGARCPRRHSGPDHEVTRMGDVTPPRRTRTMALRRVRQYGR